ncbi:MAG: hypothetical protein ACREC5_03650 [Thermoplasmata archaeon]
MPPLPNTPPSYAGGWAPPPPRAKHTARNVAIVVVGVAVAVALVLVTILASGGYISGPRVTAQVTGTDWYTDPNDAPIASGPGFSLAAGDSTPISISVSYDGCFLFCSANEVVSNPSAATPGFTVVSSNAPVTIPAGESGTLTVTVEFDTGNGDYNGPLAIVITEAD